METLYGEDSGNANIVPKFQAVNELRACRVCFLVKSYTQFVEDGCDNCGYRDRAANENTTTNFKGMVAMMQPGQSWVHKWQRMKADAKPGCYAVSLEDRMGAADLDRTE